MVAVVQIQFYTAKIDVLSQKSSSRLSSKQTLTNKKLNILP